MNICLHKGYFLLLGDHKGEFPHFAGSFSRTREKDVFFKNQLFVPGVPGWNSRRFAWREP